MRRVRVAGALAAVMVCTAPVAGQLQSAPLAAQTAPSMPWMPQSAGEVDLTPPLLSLVLPGAGQHVLGQRRKWAYLALEVAGWAFFVERRHAGSDYRDRYRDFAWENGRIQGSARVDGDFEYFERLAHWSRSGAFDENAGAPGVQPELDGTTFNGSVWDRAVGLFLGGDPSVPPSSPAYQNALAYYSGEAYGPELLWDWTGAPAAQTEYAALLDTSDTRFRQATTVLGVVLANHILSAADAYLSSRRRSEAPRLRVMPDPYAGWTVILSVPSPR